MSSFLSPALDNAFGKANAGEVVNHLGSCSASANPFIMAIGLIPNSFAFSALIKTNAAAPSFMVLALAAVTVPSLLNAGFSCAIFSKFTFEGSSSLSIIMPAPFFCGISTGIISSLNQPFWIAACAF